MPPLRFSDVSRRDWFGCRRSQSNEIVMAMYNYIYTRKNKNVIDHGLPRHEIAKSPVCVSLQLLLSGRKIGDTIPHSTPTYPLPVPIHIKGPLKRLSDISGLLVRCAATVSIAEC